MQVEDMLKRSFAEFHSQKKLPEKQQLLMVKLSQPTKTIEYVPFLERSLHFLKTGLVPPCFTQILAQSGGVGLY